MEIVSDNIIFALAAFYLWLLFGFLSDSVSCDMKKLLTKNILARNIIAIISFFLLFAVVDTNNKNNVVELWKKTFVVYILFLLLSKNKWYFSLPILGLIILEQSIAVYVRNKTNINNEKLDGETKIIIKHDEFYKFIKFREILQYGIVTLIFGGFLSYFMRQRKSFGKSFSLYKFLFYFTCK